MGTSEPVWSADGRRVFFFSLLWPECGADSEANKKLADDMKKGPVHAHLADDLLFMEHFDIDMVGMGPFIEHQHTPLFPYQSELLPITERFDLALKMIATLRILMKDINIVAATALQAIDPMGREKAVKIGANIIMPNITPGKSGLGSWSESDIAYYLESGFTPDYDTVGSSMVEVQENMAKLPDSDRQAIAAYLKSVPAQSTAGK